MLDYAVTLEFDKESEDKIQKIMDEVVRVTGCDYMKKAGIPPHVTLSVIQSDNEEALLSQMEEVAVRLKKGAVTFANIGIFNPLVIYLGPVMNEFLMDGCRMVNESLLKYSQAGNHGYYLPNQWVPHAAIAVKLSPETLKTAFDVVQGMFTPFVATAEKIVFARAVPYEELRSWSLL